MSKSSTNPPREFPLDLFIEIIPWLSKDDLPTWALVNREVLTYVRRALYGSLEISNAGICKLMTMSSQFLALTKHLRITYGGYTKTPKVVVGFLDRLVGLGNLCSFALFIQKGYARDPIQDDIVYPVFRNLLISLPSLARIEIMNMSSPSGSATPSFTSFLRRVMSHPALCSLTFLSCRDANILLHGIPKSTPLVSLGINLYPGHGMNIGWAELSTHLDLTQLRRLSLRWVNRPSSNMQRVFQEDIQSGFHLPNLTHLYFEVDNNLVQSHLNRFFHTLRSVQCLALGFTSIDGLPYQHLTSALSELHADALESISIYVPVPWAFQTKAAWPPFFEELKRFTSLRHAEVFFARVADPANPILPPTLMRHDAATDFIHSMKSNSLLPYNIHIIQNAQISDIRPFNP
ncbi:hypothetical protein DL96DRAFT_1607596 [Flagelloscypha sp. PMI_526]|nr:hypothetical protein DL96DRAFT_1607596 [Flagelloscypha sp. PMI_526]